MRKQLRRKMLGCLCVLLGSTSGVINAAPLESVTGLDVHNPGAFFAALDRYFNSDDARDGNVAVWAVDFSGASEISHLAISQFDSYGDYEEQITERNASQGWGRFVSSVTSLLDVESRLMAIERFREGSGWQGHGALAAFVMTITDPAAYTDAFTEFVGATDNPGSVRMMELRYGGQGATHAVLISAENVTELNEYLDELLGSDAYRVFAGKVSGIRTIQNVEMLTRVVTYGE